MKDTAYMHIVYASDDNFAEIMGISITSLLENNKDIEDITIYILDGGIKETNKKRLEELLKSYNRRIPNWIPAKNINDELSMEVQMDRGSISQYARLFISSLLPETIDRVLYLDCDIIVDRPLSELWNIDMKGRTIAALMDAFSRHYRANIGLEPGDIMFNSGVMLIDMQKWKANSIEDKLLRYITSRKGKIQQGDQGALNAILSHDMACLEPRFNSVTIFYDFSYKEMLIYRKPPKFYSEEEVRRAVEEPVIIHYTTSFLSKRPWEKDCKHKYTDKWLLYKNISPWSEEPLRMTFSKKTKKAYMAFHKALPVIVAVHLAGLLQAYGRPFLYYFLNIYKDNMRQRYATMYKYIGTGIQGTGKIITAMYRKPD